MSSSKDHEAAVISRLDALIDAVNRLTDAVERGAHTQDAPARTRTSEALAAPPAPGPAEVPASQPPAEPLEVASTDQLDVVEVIIDEQVVSGVPGPSAGFKALLARMFKAASEGEPEQAWVEMTALTHPRELVAPRALDSLKAFSWKQLRKNAQAYLKDGAYDSFVVVRTDPVELRGDEDRVKVFLSARGRSPAPVTIKRDEASGGAWRLGQVSL